MKKYLVILLALGLLAGCRKPAMKREMTDNPEFSVSLLFTYDSIKVYRFTDNGRTHYFTKNMAFDVYTTGSAKARISHTEEIPNN